MKDVVYQEDLAVSLNLFLQFFWFTQSVVLTDAAHKNN